MSAASSRRPAAGNSELHISALLTEADRDELDMIDEELVCNPYAGDPPSRRKDKEIGKLLGILDGLERGMHERG